MSKAQFAPSAVILALAGDKAAGVQAAFDALQFGLLQIIAHGNNRTLSDTLQALAGLKGAQAKRVQACTQEAYETAQLEKLTGKAMPDKGAARAALICDAARMAYDSECTSDAAASAEKRAAAKVKKAAEAKAAEKAARAEAHAAQQPLTLADAVAFLRAALASGSVDAGLHLDALVSEFYTETQAPAGEIVGEAREVGAALALQH